MEFTSVLIIVDLEAMHITNPNESDLVLSPLNITIIQG